jgi:hypothetical protein
MLGKLLADDNRSRAGAVDSAVASAEFADQDQLLLQCLAGAVYADSGVAGRNANLLRKSFLWSGVLLRTLLLTDEEGTNYSPTDCSRTIGRESASNPVPRWRR